MVHVQVYRTGVVYVHRTLKFFKRYPEFQYPAFQGQVPFAKGKNNLLGNQVALIHFPGL